MSALPLHANDAFKRGWDHTDGVATQIPDGNTIRPENDIQDGDRRNEVRRLRLIVG